jgi:hypothetical protein
VTVVYAVLHASLQVVWHGTYDVTVGVVGHAVLIGGTVSVDSTIQAGSTHCSVAIGQ